MKKAVIIILLVAAVLAFAGCDLIGSELFLPDYMGKWVKEYDDGSKITYNFAREDWDVLIQAEVLGELVDVSAGKGTMTNDGSFLTLTQTHEKKADPDWGIIDPETGWTAVETVPAPVKIGWAVENKILTLTAEDDSKLELTRVEDE